MNQRGLFDLPRTTYPENKAGATLEEQFVAFHQANPHIFDMLREMALELQTAGRKRYGISGLFEVLRWRYAVKTSEPDFKLNNNHRAFYARKLMSYVPELRGFFAIRTQRRETNGQDTKHQTGVLDGRSSAGNLRRGEVGDARTHLTR